MRSFPPTKPLILALSSNSFTVSSSQTSLLLPGSSDLLCHGFVLVIVLTLSVFREAARFTGDAYHHRI
jgi:hypothetical protein